MTTAQALKRLRERLRWTQRGLATELRKTVTTVARWEAGARNPSPEIYEKLAGLCEGELSEFFAAKAGVSGLVPESNQPARARRREPAAGGGGARRMTATPTEAQTRMELHTALDIVLDRAPDTVREKLAENLEQWAARYGTLPVRTLELPRRISSPAIKLKP